jgi:hypothetical protein
VPKVDAAVSAAQTERSGTVSEISVSITGLGEDGGILEITTNNNTALKMGGDCPGSEPARQCTLAPGTTELNFMVNTGHIEDVTMVYFHVEPMGAAVDPNGSNDNAFVELKPAS